jgi:hypothetical protein
MNLKGAVFQVVVGIFLLNSLAAFSQTKINDTFGKGITFLASDSSFKFNFKFRIQNRYDGFYLSADDTSYSGPTYEDKFYIRRSRIKMSGFAFSPKLKYKFEYDLVKGVILDAVIKWNFAGNFDLWVGQTKLAGNRERVISSQNLQFVDRSLLNSNYTLDRDKGLQLRHHFNLGKILIREVASISVGEGINYTNFSGNSGYNCTERVEILPFGEFKKKGDYIGGDIAREENLKLSLGFTYDYNDNAIQEHGQKGDVMTETRDLTTFFADLMLKYKGLSILGEYTTKSARVSPTIVDTSGLVIESFYTGTGINLQLGYLFKKNWEIAGRMTQITPDDMTGNPNIAMYTLGISKYIVGHSLKVQSDFSIIQTEGEDDMLGIRVQMELAL